MSVSAWRVKPISRRTSTRLLYIPTSHPLPILNHPPKTRTRFLSTKLSSWQPRQLVPSLRSLNVSPIGYISYKAHLSFPLSRYPAQLRMIQTRSYSNKNKLEGKGDDAKTHEHVSGQSEHDSNFHSEHESHSHSIFGHSHSHGEDGHSHTHDAEQIIAALKGSGDRGSYITLVGLFSNVALTGIKGAAGWYLHSASLLADAGHSLSDLLGDFVTLFCWRLSRKPPSERYPYGFAKFETLGTTTISLLLIGGALGIGFHSYHLLITALGETAVTLPPGYLKDMLYNVTTTASLPPIGHGHVHSVDPNAAWFAAVSVVAKEWLYRITKVVADEEKSPVLLANAVHHRSDAYSSLVAFFAIIGTWIFPAFPLDPIGGLLVSIVIFKQGFDLLAGAWGDLTDASVTPKTRKTLEKALRPLLESSARSDSTNTSNLTLQNLRARQAGSMLFVDIIVEVDGRISIIQASELEFKIEKTLRAARKEIAEVRVSFKPAQKI